MRFMCAAVVVIWAGLPAKGQGPVKHKQVASEDGRIQITVPFRWTVKEAAGSVLIRVAAPGALGGHELIVVSEAGQGELDPERARYIRHDSERYAGAAVRKLESPFFGYRLEVPAKNRVILRAFLADGDDGVVASLSSRLKMFDRYYAKTAMEVLASLRVGKDAPAPAESGGASAAGRIYDKLARVSLVAPDGWRPLAGEEDEWVVLAYHGKPDGTVLRLLAAGGPTNANLVLSSRAREWKQSYAGLSLKKLPGKPPRFIARNRRPGWVDYVIGLAAGDRGFLLTLEVREKRFERHRPAADATARSIVFTHAPYAEPGELPGDIVKPFKQLVLIHHPAERVSQAERIARELDGFPAAWKRIGPRAPRKAPPLHIVLTGARDFAEIAEGFGEPPCCYDPRKHTVIVVAPPVKEPAMLPGYRGRLFEALAQAALQRDLKGRAPAWLRAGLSACMDAAGRTGAANGPHPALAKILDNKASSESLIAPRELFAMTDADFLLAETEDHRAMAYGYMHLMLFGKGSLPGFYRRWIRLVEKAPGRLPVFDLKKYSRGEKDLAKHVQKFFGS